MCFVCICVFRRSKKGRIQSDFRGLVMRPHVSVSHVLVIECVFVFVFMCFKEGNGGLDVRCSVVLLFVGCASLAFFCITKRARI
jgi:hypothetical protein